MLCSGERITAAKLRQKVTDLNRVLGRPEEGWTKTEDGLQANIGHLYLDGAYSGYRLEQHTNDDGCAQNVSDRMSAREMYYFLAGMEAHGVLWTTRLCTTGGQ